MTLSSVITVWQVLTVNAEDSAPEMNIPTVPRIPRILPGEGDAKFWRKLDISSLKNIRKDS